MKIKLIVPPKQYQTKETMPPLGLAWIAAVLRDNGYNDVKIIDTMVLGLTIDELIKLLEQDPSDVIGITVLTQVRFMAFELARKIKRNFPKTIIIAGGFHVTLCVEDTLKHIPIDYIVRGEGEYVILKLIKALEGQVNINDVQGISYKNARGEIIHNKRQELILNIDSLPLPARDLLPLEKYQQKLPESDFSCTTLITSRGCPYLCSYCAVSIFWGSKIRYRSPKNIVDEMEILKKKYQFDGFLIHDDTFTASKKRVMDICNDIIKRKLDIKFWCELRADTVDREVMSKMKEAGCYMVAMGVESGSQKILDRIKKGITLKEAEQAAMIINNLGIKLKIFLMVGHPDENYDDIKKTISFTKYLGHKYQAKASFGVTIVYPGTEIERLAKLNKCLPEDFSWARPYSGKKSYQPLAVAASMPIFEQARLSYEDIYNFVRKARLSYYLKHLHYLIPDALRQKKAFIIWLKAFFRGIL